MNKSIWQESIKKIDGKVQSKVDVLIIGGGLSGMSTAFSLKDSNMKVELIESNEISSGATSLTTGKLTYLQDTMCSDIEGIHGFDIAKKYIDSQMYGLNLVRNIIKKNNIECDFIENDSYIFAYKDEDKEKINKEYNLFKKANINAEIVKNLPINFPCNYAMKVSDTAVFNPVKYVNKLYELTKEKVNICEKVRALEIKKDNDI